MMAISTDIAVPFEKVSFSYGKLEVFRELITRIPREGICEVLGANEAGLLIENLPELWEGATLEEKHRLVKVMFDAVFVDHKIEKSIVCIRPKTAFRSIFQDIKTRKGSGVFLTIMDDEQIAA